MHYSYLFLQNIICVTSEASVIQFAFMQHKIHWNDVGLCLQLALDLYLRYVWEYILLKQNLAVHYHLEKWKQQSFVFERQVNLN